MGRLTREFALGLGSNAGDRRGSLLGAARGLSAMPGLLEFALSGLYESPPWGGVSGGPFLNAVMTGRAEIDLRALVAECRRLEEAAGSPRLKMGGARNLDLDILFVDPGDPAVSGIVLPHPRMHLRRFVLEPLCLLRPGREVPGLGRTCEQLMAECPDTSHITLLEEAPPGGKIWSDAG